MPKTFGFAINLWESPWSSPQRLSQRDASGNRSIKLQRSDEFTMQCLGTFFPGKFHGFDPFIHVFVLGLSYASLLFFLHELSTFDVTHRCIGHSPEGGKNPSIQDFQGNPIVTSSQCSKPFSRFQGSCTSFSLFWVPTSFSIFWLFT